MSSRGLNVCTFSGNVAAIEPKSTKTGANLMEIVIYVDNIPKKHQKDSFTVKVTVWENSAASRKVPYIDKGSLIIVTGSIQPSPYISKNDGQAYAGLQLTAMDIFLDSSPRTDEYSDIPGGSADQPSL